MAYFKFKKGFTYEEKLETERSKMMVTCKCGHRNSFYAFEGNHKICSWCGNCVFRNKKAEFEYRMKEILIRQKRGEMII